MFRLASYTLYNVFKVHLYSGCFNLLLFRWSVVDQLCLIFVTPWTAALQAFWSFTISRSLLKLMSIESVMPPNHLALCHPILLQPSIFPSIRVFSNESAIWIGRPKYWSFIISIGPSNEYLGLISLRIEWFDLPTVQGTLKSLLQHHSSKASIFWCSAPFMSSSDHLPFLMELTVLGTTTMLQVECWRVPTSFGKDSQRSRPPTSIR